MLRPMEASERSMKNNGYGENVIGGHYKLWVKISKSNNPVTLLCCTLMDYLHT